MTAGLPPRVVFLAPRAGESGVGDHAEDLLAELRRHVCVVELRHGGPGEDRAVDIWRLRRRLRRLLATSPPGTVVHSELSGGASPPFWATFGLDVRRTATLHDAPRPVWFPALTRGIKRTRVLSPVLLRLLSPVWLWVERRALRDVDVVTLTRAGAALTRQLGIGARVRVSHLLVPERPAAPPPWERPAAVGMFGHVYRGKGFDLLPRLRAALPDDIAIRVAGRGTDSLPRVRGVEVLGAVEGPDEAAFFGSIRVLLLPYHRAPIGGISALAASAAHLVGAAFDTPAIATRWPTMDELAAAGGCLLADDLAEMVAMATELCRSGAAVRAAHTGLTQFRDTQTVAGAVAPYLEMWADR